MISRKSFQHLEPLFQYLKKNSFGSVALSYCEIEKIIGQELSYAEKTDERYWRQPKLKKLSSKYDVVFWYIDTVKGTMLFLVGR